ncbi:MAG: gliding motility lipoprotein GldH [Prevotellaceae bacterium]|jgi:gliding motility-associated lipoprotein GldH|nr:gliding motility lipoprotein GldH [Prevotellaceae bacterium]
MLNIVRKTQKITESKRGGARLILAVALAMLASSCSDEARVWEQSQTVNNCEWRVDEALIFTMPVNDTLTWFDLLFDLRSRDDYPYSNLYLFVTTEAPNGAFSVDTVQYELFDESGGRKGGGGSISRFAEIRVPFRTKIRFPVKGNYMVKIKHGMRDDLLKGVASLGLRLEK